MNPSGQWEEYPYYVSMEGLHSASPVSTWRLNLLIYFTFLIKFLSAFPDVFIP